MMRTNLLATGLFLGLTTGLMTTVSPVQAETDSSTIEKIEAAVADERRPEADRVRDANRKPLETLTFFGLKEDMHVLELLPGGGWYTRILAPVLNDNGKLYISIGAERAAAALEGEAGFENMTLIPFDRARFSRPEGSRQSDVPAFSFGVKKLDMVLTFRNQHNFTATGRRNLNQAVFESLKKGGTYGIIDHTRRHMEGDHAEVWRRMDPVLIIKEVQEAGFQLVDYSTLHYRPDDELRYEVGRKSVTGNTDRFTLLFIKP
jgi:predicted methyltransferase